MVQAFNPVLNNVVRRTTSEGDAHDSGVDGSDALQSQNYLDGGYSERNGRLASRSGGTVDGEVKPITSGGIVAKTAICLCVDFLAAVVEILITDRSHRLGLLLGIVGIISSLAIICVSLVKTNGSFKCYALGYAVTQGLAVGLVVAALQIWWHDGFIILEQCLLSVIGVFVGMLLLYMFKKGNLNSIPRYQINLITAGTALIVFSAGYVVYGFITGHVPLNNVAAIIVSLLWMFWTPVLMFNDFNAAENMVEVGTDRQETWSVAFGLIVALVWSYLGIIHSVVGAPDTSGENSDERD